MKTLSEFIAFVEILKDLKENRSGCLPQDIGPIAK